MKKIQRCSNCEYTITKESEELLPKQCPQCQSKSCVIKFVDDLKPKKEFVNICLNDSPRLSRTLGCHEKQINQMRKIHPDATFIKKGRGYVMLIKNRTEKKQRANERWGKGQWDEWSE